METQVYSEEEIRSLIETNKILKEHAEFLRVKLRNAENLLELYVKTQEEHEDLKNKNYSLN